MIETNRRYEVRLVAAESFEEMPRLRSCEVWLEGSPMKAVVEIGGMSLTEGQMLAYALRELAMHVEAGK